MKLKVIESCKASKEDIDTREKAMCEACRTSGLKVTQQRIALFRELLRGGEHLSAEDLYDRLKSSYSTLSLSTVYNTLQTLAGLGMIGVVTQPEGPMLYDPTNQPHDHLYCNDCNNVLDVYSDTLPDPQSYEIENNSFEIHNVMVLYQGRCPSCIKRAATGTSPA